MKQFKIFSVLAFVGLSLISCNSSENDPYWPNPEKGDYVMVERMEVIHNVEKEHLVEKMYDIVYGPTLKLKIVKEYSNVDMTTIPSKAPLSYEFEYRENKTLLSITTKKDEEIVIEKSIADFRNDKLESITVEGTSKVAKYEYLNSNQVSVTQNGKTYKYEFDNRGNLTSVSDESGKLFTYEYGTGYNPFVYSEYNLLFDYVPGGEVIRFVFSSKNDMKLARNEKTGEVFKFTYKLDEFGYPIRMEVEGKSAKTLVKFKNGIKRPNIGK
ncbi:hypothetical protein HX052_16960 [Myroides marinus]|uniref:hypothetical protein n=1 Tax=Myroides marinus TaxID=703342 RepID=UPI0025767EAE|nr:hypothetical protein [Myroides marinus]MDM1367851.1 hypothetical protein [Myroides marinus]MDM1373689.1 hypothetical protein [Myroides marinus]MDM1376229.1 hypothetical protein [Myroides marinus]MDM1382271.1 hypothetical protein [Myroides marinus]MDM1391629.1 hypothetical protein [Myroides marinus]